ncbi:MAG TPA: hypothetical protein VGR02_03045 [Thermoanaerobaculia bacterium]|jgi:uncharacterized membrane protein|nr:hypothetical protein [Thermoanaerobaculia bacterium]
MPVSPLVIIHICAAVVGLLSGYLSMLLRKGSGLHQAAGNVFFVSMLIMSSTAAYIATFLHPIRINIVASLLTFYLVSTAWWAARHRDGRTGSFDVGALFFVCAVTLGALTFGFQAASSPNGTLDRMPAFMYFVFGTVALLHVVSDVRLLVRRGVTGTGRIVRHLSRMCLALLIATMSFYPGQAKLFSRAVRETNLLFIPHVLLIGSLLFWLVRMRSRKRRPLEMTPLAQVGAS